MKCIVCMQCTMYIQPSTRSGERIKLMIDHAHHVYILLTCHIIRAQQGSTPS